LSLRACLSSIVSKKIFRLQVLIVRRSTRSWKIFKVRGLEQFLERMV
jgi:hypothetical protein